MTNRPIDLINDLTARIIANDPDADPIRDLLLIIDPITLTFDDTDDPAFTAFPALTALLIDLIDACHRDDLTDLALATSLCPLHFIDYAICFDDDDPACAAIRTIHPAHDT
jgi:hypothetical protein